MFDQTVLYLTEISSVYSVGGEHIGVLDYFRGEKIGARWFACRETFDEKCHKNLLLRDKIFYATYAKIDFLFEIEKILNIKIDSYVCRAEITIDYKKFTNIYYIKPAPFWLENRIRWNFLTIVLRGLRFYSGNLDGVFINSQYTSSNMTAVNLFLKGFTNYTGNVYGWCNAFNPVQTRPLLIKPVLSEDDRFELVKKQAYVLWEKDNVKKDDSYYFAQAVEEHRQAMISFLAI